MPLINTSQYRPPVPFRNAHVNTVYPALFRKVKGVHFERERIDTPDGDFLDLDWSVRGSDRLMIVLHGLEGSADRHYIKGMIRAFQWAGWDGLGMNFRGCSGEDNLQLRTYHMAETDDLHQVIEHALSTGRYKTIALAGFSLGGSVVLNYLGRRSDQPKEVKAGLAYSVPCHIVSANDEISRLQNYVYLKRFMKTLNKKYAEKRQRFPEELANSPDKAQSFRTFDNHFTAPVHGFQSGLDYWESASCLPFLQDIKIPVLLMNSADDTFLSMACYPVEEARASKQLFLEIPQWGGHVGFYDNKAQNNYWSEQRGLEFVRTFMN